MGGEARQAGRVLLEDVLHARRVRGHDLDQDGVLPPTGPSPFAGPDEVTRWFAAQREHIVAVLRSMVAEREFEQAALVLSQVWALVPVDADEAWCRELRDCGKGLADALPASAVLARAFRRGSALFAARGMYRVAEVEGMRELAVWRERDDRDATAAALDWLAGVFAARRRLHRVIDCANQKLALYLRHDHPAGVARTLRDLGALMLRAGRADAAIDYLTRAAKAQEALPAAPVRQRAELTVLLGRALWASGSQGAARRRFSSALALLVDVDDDAADHVRALLDTPPGAPLPESVPQQVDQGHRHLDQ